MDTLMAGLFGMANRGREQKVFDWENAANIIKRYLEEHKGDDIVIEASLAGDEGNTFGYIYSDGEFNFERGCAYLASTWATPQLVIYNYADGTLDTFTEEDEIKIPCFKMQHEVPDWNYSTWFPKEFVDILGLDTMEVTK